MAFDNLEYLSIQKQVTDFPMHFHETFCISLIHNGIEKINFEGHTLFCENLCISITNPYEIHSNPLIDSSVTLQFDTIYISKDLMKYLNNGQNISFKDKIIKCSTLNELFIELREAIDTNNNIFINKSLKGFTRLLNTYSEQKNEAYSEFNLNTFENLSQFIDDNITDKLNLEQLSNFSNLNKYSFSKKFKSTTGMSPMNYILMKKIFSSKKVITKDTELTEIAYDYNFTDMAHYSNAFKRFVGISPKKYQNTISNF